VTFGGAKIAMNGVRVWHKKLLSHIWTWIFRIIQSVKAEVLVVVYYNDNWYLRLILAEPTTMPETYAQPVQTSLVVTTCG